MVDYTIKPLLAPFSAAPCTMVVCRAQPSGDSPFQFGFESTVPFDRLSNGPWYLVMMEQRIQRSSISHTHFLSEEVQAFAVKTPFGSHATQRNRLGGRAFIPQEMLRAEMETVGHLNLLLSTSCRDFLSLHYNLEDVAQRDRPVTVLVLEKTRSLYQGMSSPRR